MKKPAALVATVLVSIGCSAAPRTTTLAKPTGNLDTTAVSVPSGGASYGAISVADVEGNADALVTAEVVSISAAKFNLTSDQATLSSRAVLDATVPLTTIRLKIVKVLGARSNNRFADKTSFAVGRLLDVVERHGTVNFDTTEADRIRLGLTDNSDGPDGRSSSPRTGVITLTRSFDSEIFVKVGDLVAAYLTMLNFGFADDERTPNIHPGFAASKYSVFHVSPNGELDVPKELLNGDRLANLDALALSGSRIAASTAPSDPAGK